MVTHPFSPSPFCGTPMRALFLLILLIAPAAAHGSGHDEPWPDDDPAAVEAARKAGLFGAFSARPGGASGDFVSFTTDASGIHVSLQGTPIYTIHGTFGTPDLHGPSAVWPARVEVHDNRYAWALATGDFTVNITFPGPTTTVPGGLDAMVGDTQISLRTTAPVQRTTDGWALEGGSLWVSLEPGIAVHGTTPGAWALIAHADGGIASDWLRIDEAPFKVLSAAPDSLAIEAVGTIGDGALDQLVRIESVGIFTGTDKHVLRHGGIHYARDASLSAPGFHVTGTDIVTHTVREATGHSGRMSLERDTIVPVAQITFSGLDPYNPLAQEPRLDAVVPEPVYGTLTIGDYVKKTVQPAYEVAFRLTGLEPDTAYAYTLELEDAAGNVGIQEGTFRTGAGPAYGASIQITPTASGFTFEAHGVPEGASVALFADKRPVTQEATIEIANGTWSGSWTGPVATSIRGEVRAGGTVIANDDVQLTKGSPMPFAGLALLVALLRRPNVS